MESSEKRLLFTGHSVLAGSALKNYFGVIDFFNILSCTNIFVVFFFLKIIAISVSDCANTLFYLVLVSIIYREKALEHLIIVGEKIKYTFNNIQIYIYSIAK